jgi:adenosylmethionine-8-amino-7-oxononanoate aminotransferase
VALENAYHGDTFGAMSVSARGLFTDPFRDRLFEVVRLPDPSTGDAPGSLRSLLEERSGEIAAVIVEPRLLGAGGMRIWGGDALREIRELTRQNGILLIADEVLTGFGRTGPLFACGGASVEPDLLCLSKGLTGGFLPLGVTAATEELFDVFRTKDRRQTFFHGHSYSGNPLACVAARATLSLLNGECESRRAEIEATHRSHLDRLTDHPRVRNPRVLGTIAAFDLAGEEGYLAGAGPALSRFAIDRGVLLRPLGNVVYLLPPYCFTTDELGQVYEVIEAYLEAG